MAGERRDGALAVGPGHRDDFGPVLPGEELDVAGDRDLPLHRFAHQRLGECQPGADADEIDVLEQCRVERAEMQFPAEAFFSGR
jgi:hypothetical protein